MQTSPHQRFRRSLLLAALCLPLLTGATPRIVTGQDTSPPSPDRAAATFAAVSEQLDPGGDLYLILNVERWLKHLSATISKWQALLSTMAGPDPDARAQIDHGFELLARLVQRSGVEDIAALGLSGRELPSGWFRTRSVVLRGNDAPDGFLWTAFGRAPHPLSLLDLLPSTTAMATGFDLAPRQLWQVLESEMARSGSAAYRAWAREWPTHFESATGVAWLDFLNGFGLQHAIVLTLDERHPVSLPAPGGAFDIPTPGLTLIFEVTDATLANLLAGAASSVPESEVIERHGTVLRVVPIPAPTPFPIRLTLAHDGNHLILGSSDDLVAGILGLKRGTEAGLRAGPGFHQLAQDLPLTGNAFSYVGPELGNTLTHIQQRTVQSVVDEGDLPAEVADLLDQWIHWNRIPPGFAVSAITPAGWTAQAHGEAHPTAALLKPALLAPAAMGAGMMVPALTQAKSKAQSIHCINNLKQIGLAARIWALDHEDRLPSDFPSMRQELANPAVLICPADPLRAGTVPDWDTFNDADVSYEMVAPGISETEVHRVYVRCKVHGHAVHADGSVRQAGF